MFDINKLTKIERIIYDNMEYVSQTSPDTTKELLIQKVIDDLQNGRSIAIEDGGVVLLVHRKTRWLAEIHIFGESSSTRIVRSAINITRYIFENTELNVIYAHSHNFKFGSIIKKTGWEYMGTIPKSFWDGEKFIDQILVGAVKENFLKFLEKKKS